MGTRRRHTPEQIIRKLREGEKLLGQGSNLAEVAKHLEVYDPQDVERGYLERADRRGNLQRAALLTLSVGVATSTSRNFTEPREVAAVASEMKEVAKRHGGSYVALDRRRRTGPTGQLSTGGAGAVAQPAGL